jgi:hypothetical protein
LVQNNQLNSLNDPNNNKMAFRTNQHNKIQSDPFNFGEEEKKSAMSYVPKNSVKVLPQATDSK